jgi:hypothetical protein
VLQLQRYDREPCCLLLVFWSKAAKALSTNRLQKA